MAIDTENKRRSVHAYAGAIVYPRADGAITKPDREHSAWLYAGIPASAPPAVTLQVYGRHAKRHGPQRRLELS
jgi:hypothetical protein